MDTYLPADFYRLHAAVAEDWRDASSAPPYFPVTKSTRSDDAQREGERIVDPGWVGI